MRPVPRGYAFAVASSVGLGLAIAAARAAWEGGTTPISVAPVRAVLLCLVLLAVCLATGRSLVLPARDRWHCLGIGVLSAQMFYGNIASVETIPVGLGALCFFVYPPVVGILAAALDRRWPRAGTMGALALAFAGVGLALGVGFDTLDPRGVFLGISAGLACASTVVWLSRALREADPLVVMLHFSSVAAVILIAAALLTGDLVPPKTPSGWVGAVGVVALQVSSIPLYFAAIRLIGGENTAMLNNLQPLTSIFAAWILYGEQLGPWQWCGTAMVLGGIAWMQASLRRG